MNRNRLKKRIVAGTMAALVTATSVPVSTATFNLPQVVNAAATAEPTTTTDGFKISNGVVIGYNGTAKDIVIPNNVTEIGAYAFTSKEITSITIPSNVKKIGNGAFSRCKELTSVVIPETVNEIGNHIFSGCESLKTASIKSKQVGEFQFLDCKSLTDVKMEGVEKIGLCAFFNCEALTEITIPTTVEKIGEQAFMGCKELQRVTIQDGVAEIGDSAFKDLTKLKNVKFGTSLKSIGDRAFEGTSLESIELLSVEMMGQYVFAGCKNLKDVTLRTGVKRIGKGCFIRSNNVEKVTIEPGLEVIGEAAFCGLEKVKEIALPSTLVMIEDDAFLRCTALETVQFPSNLKYVGGEVFAGTIWYIAKKDAAEQADTPYVVEGNVLLGTVSTISDEKFEIPPEVTVIAKATNNETTLEIPDHITGIGSDAFLGSSKLTKLTLPDSITFIGNGAFFGMDKLEKIKLPAYIQNIYEMTFSDCEALKSITVPENVKSIGWSAFEKCTALKEVNLPNGLERIGNEAFLDCSSLKELTIPSSVTIIGKDIVKNCAAGFVIKGYTGSAAEIYAKENNITFQSIGIIDPEQTVSPTTTVKPTTKPTVKPTETPVETTSPSLSVTPTIPANPTTNPEGEKYTVTLDVNGGLAEKTSITVINGSTYNELPSASKAGYIFGGWYTALEGGTKIENTTSVNLTTDQTLYAHWVELSCNLKFDANGGIADIQEKSVLTGEVYGELPIPTKTGATFLGWYTAKEGGDLITEDMVVTLTGDITIYAHWESSYKKISVDTLTYNFENSNSGFGYSDDYQIPYSVFKYIYGDTLYAQELFDREGIWGGNCFGMSSTSIFFNVDTDDIDVSDFSKGKTLPSELNKKDKDTTTQLSLTKFIEAMQVSQYDSKLLEIEYESWDDLDGLCNAVENVQNKKGEPVIICIYGPTGGHAMVGYKIEGNKLYVYDPNYPKDNTRAITLKKDSSGNVVSWYYFLNDSEDWGSEYDDCAISYIPYSAFYQVWEKKTGKCYTLSNLLKVNTDSANIYDENNKQVAQIKEGQLITSDPDITQLQKREVTKNSKKTSGCEIFLPTGKYTIENTGTNKTFDVQVMGTDMSVDATTTAAKVTINLDDIENENNIHINAKHGESYNITLKSLAENDKENIVIKGTGKGTAGVGVSQKQGDINFENCQSANIKVDGKSVKPIQITAKAGNGGTLSREGTKNVVGGEDITYAITADYGYMIKDVLVDGVSQGNISSYTFPNVNATHTIEAVFEEADITKAEVNVVSEKLQANGLPKIQVKIGNQILSEKDDYIVSCKSKTDKTMLLQIKGVNFYKGTITKEAAYTANQETTDSAIKKGKIYTIGNLKYKVTNTSKKTVTVVKKAKSVKSVTVPSTVKINKISFKVTAIGSSVWKNDKKLQNLTIGANVKSIGANACNGAKNLKKIIIKGTSLEKIGAKALKNISPKAVIKVPKKKKAAYKKLFKGKGQKKTVVIK